MEKFFGENYTGEPFEIFSTAHINAISVIFFCCIMIYLFNNKLKKEKVNLYFRYSFALILIFVKIIYYIWLYVNNLWSFSEDLPLHLCEAAVILSIILLLSKSYFLYEFLYFWTICGVLSAIITPELNGYNSHHFIFYHFFISHGLVVMAIMFMTFVNGYQPRAFSILKSMLISNVYMFFVAIVNILTGGNYLFICKKPKVPSIMDFLGPWPWYIFSLELVALVGFSIAYLPFKIRLKLKKSHAKKDM